MDAKYLLSVTVELSLFFFLTKNKSVEIKVSCCDLFAYKAIRKVSATTSIEHGCIGLPGSIYLRFNFIEEMYSLTKKSLLEMILIPVTDAHTTHIQTHRLSQTHTRTHT